MIKSIQFYNIWILTKPTLPFIPFIEVSGICISPPLYKPHNVISTETAMYMVGHDTICKQQTLGHIASQAQTINKIPIIFFCSTQYATVSC